MNLHGGQHDRPPAVDMKLEGRLRAAGKALRESSITQVDAATGLREILHTSRLAGDDLADPPQEPAGVASPPQGSTAARLFRSPQRLALAVNLLLVLVLGVLLVRVATYQREPVGATPTTASSAAPTTVVASKPKVVTSVTVPESCVETAELADEVISRLNRHERDQRLFLTLRDYTVASQACRRAAASS
jgi:hypothetical protein